MIGLRLAKKRFVKLYRNAAITIQYTSLFFQESAEHGSYAAGFTFPARSNNSSDLTNHYSEHTATTPQIFEDSAEIFKDTFLIDSGRFEFQEVTEEEFSVNIFLGVDALPVMKKKLSELNLGGNRTIGADSQDVIDHAKDQNTYEYPDVDYVFPIIYNDKFYPVDKNPHFFGIINRWDPINQKFFINEVQSGIVENRDTIIPYAFVKYIIKRIFAETPFAVGGDFMDDTETDQFLLENNYALDDFGEAHGRIYVGAPSGPLVTWLPFPFPVETTPFYDPDNQFTSDKWKIPVAGTTEIVLHFEFNYTPPGAPDNVITVEIVQDDGTFHILWQQPYSDISGNHVIDITINPEFSDDEVGNDIFIRIDWIGFDGGAFDVIDATLKITPPAFGNVNEYKKTINLQNHVPDMTCGEFLVRLMSSYGFAPDYNKEGSFVALNYKTSIQPIAAKDYTRQAFASYQKQLNKEKSKLPEYEFPSDDKATERAKIDYDPVGIITVATRDDLPAATAPDVQVLVLNSMTIYKSYYEPALPGYLYNVDGFPFKNDFAPDETAQDLKALATPVMMRQTVLPGGEFYPTLYMDQEGTSIAYGLAPQNNTEVRVAIWRDMDTWAGNDVPFASNHKYTIDGTLRYGLTLDLKGEDGVMEHFWGDWMTWINHGLRWIRKFTFSLVDFLNYNIYKPFRVRQNYFIAVQSTASIESAKDSIEMEIESIEMIKSDPVWGAELLLETDFPDPSMWWSASGDVSLVWTFGLPGAQKNNYEGALSQFFAQEVKSPFGQYKAVFTITSRTAGQAFPAISLVSGTPQTTNGTFEEVLNVDGPIGVFAIYCDAPFDGIITLASLKARVG